MELTDDDVLQILKLIDESKFDYFQLEMGELKITVSKGEPPAAAQTATNSPAGPAPGATPALKPAAPAPEPPSERPKTAAGSETRAVADGLVPIPAPLLGTFYVAPEPGAAPFVSVGSKVTADTTVGLIEVMKVFNSVRAGVSGVIVEIVAQNGQFVEYGQPLFLVKPS